MSVQVTVEEVGVEVVLPLRSAVLRGGGPAGMPGDDDPATVHLAAREPDGRVVGVARLSPAACPWRDARSPWQLRGMATEPAVRGAGTGRVLLEACLATVAGRGGDLLWCDARTTAAGFYERFGLTVVAGPYDKPGIGPHVGMLTAVPLEAQEASPTP
ncbi:Predicted N-acyltransferase, GNAT family [Geodermatophilus pulveris]|uniref:Predicted N-acyltransferase, GNAT family n=1 Tax=Geodermatophilus pulveris TaxID=1564159 RepID=A0A239GV46_9ACTN|nr:GNAT family N-acetyltransferase [Geodermatophilus pulveris]SNS72745.1 Predicted N-acyltransferase, GNAT family [Geodermatophilus pulveris]